MTEKTAIHTPTKEEYDRLMVAYEKKGWKSLCSHYVNNIYPVTVTFKEIFEHYDFDWQAVNCGYTIITVDEAIAKLGLYERGQRVLATNGWGEYERIYLATIEGCKTPYVTVSEGGEGEFFKGKPFAVSHWKTIRPFEEKTMEVTMKDIEDKYGCKVKIVK